MSVGICRVCAAQRCGVLCALRSLAAVRLFFCPLFFSAATYAVLFDRISVTAAVKQAPSLPRVMSAQS